MFTFSGYVTMGIPLAWYLGLHENLGVKGLWWGPVVACAYLTLMYNILLVCVNWDSLYDEIEQRKNKENAVRAKLLQESLQ